MHKPRTQQGGEARWGWRMYEEWHCVGGGVTSGGWGRGSPAGAGGGRLLVATSGVVDALSLCISLLFQTRLTAYVYHSISKHSIVINIIVINYIIPLFGVLLQSQETWKKQSYNQMKKIVLPSCLTDSPVWVHCEKEKMGWGWGGGGRCYYGNQESDS